MGGNKGDAGSWGVQGLMFCGRNFGTGEEQWDTEWDQNNPIFFGLDGEEIQQ